MLLLFILFHFFQAKDVVHPDIKNEKWVMVSGWFSDYEIYFEKYRKNVHDRPDLYSYQFLDDSTIAYEWLLPIPNCNFGHVELHETKWKFDPTKNIMYLNIKGEWKNYRSFNYELKYSLSWIRNNKFRLRLIKVISKQETKI